MSNDKIDLIRCVLGILSRVDQTPEVKLNEIEWILHQELDAWLTSERGWKDRTYPVQRKGESYR